jgi:hypothetical protein
MAVANVPYYQARLPFQQGRAVVLPTMKSDLDGLAQAVQFAMEHRLRRRDLNDQMKTSELAREQSVTSLADALKTSDLERRHADITLADTLQNTAAGRAYDQARTAGAVDDLRTAKQNRRLNKKDSRLKSRESRARVKTERAAAQDLRARAEATRAGKPATMEEVRHAAAVASGIPLGSDEYWKYVKGPSTSGQQINVNLPGEPPSAGERKALADTQASIDRLEKLTELWEDADSGPIIGNIWKAAGFFNLAPQAQEDFMAATRAVTNAIIKDITGAQMSQGEAERIIGQIPQHTDSPRRWRAKWKATLGNMEYLQHRRKQVLSESGLTAPFMGDITVPLTPGRPGTYYGPEVPPSPLQRPSAPVLGEQIQVMPSKEEFLKMTPKQQDDLLKQLEGK